MGFWLLAECVPREGEAEYCHLPPTPVSREPTSLESSLPFRPSSDLFHRQGHEAQGEKVLLKAVLLGRPGRLQILGGPPTSASHMLGSQACATFRILADEVRRPV